MMTADEILEEALRLPLDDQEYLYNMLWESADGEACGDDTRSNDVPEGNGDAGCGTLDLDEWDNVIAELYAQYRAEAAADHDSGRGRTAASVRLLEEVRQLSGDSRDYLRCHLAEHMTKEPGYDEAWAEEIARRLEEHDSGSEPGIPWDIAMKAMFPDKY
jgi:hypothetical protein